MARVFVSYASKDLTLACEVHQWLVEASHEVFLDQDPGDGIVVGERWRARLHERLRWADAMVCVVTSTYLESTWCAAEVATAQTRGSRLLPLHAEPDLAHPLLTEVQHADLTQNPVTARAALIAALRQIDAAGGSGWPDDRPPFPGLRSFDVDRHRVFFGRTEEIKQLAELVRSTAESAVWLVVGPSGCGKSSLVRAGLLPVLASEPGWQTLAPIVPGADPVAALARELATTARRIGLDWTVEHVHQQLGTRGLAALVDELLVADPRGPQRRLLVVVDQFEELLTQALPDQRARFAELLRPTLAGPVQVVATLRPEFLDQLLTSVDVGELPTHTYTLRPLHREALHLVIEGPARLAGLDVDEHLVSRLVGDTDSGEALPLLAFTLAQLADGVSRGGRLSATHYDQLGGVQGALTRHADAALAAAVTAGGRRREEVIAGLLRLVTVDEHGRPTRWRVNRAELPTSVVTELDAFVTRRLVITDTDNGTVVIGVAHEAFLSAWPPLAEAITANVTALRARRAVEHAATEWHDGERPPSRLWEGGQLAAVVADTGARICAVRTPPPRREGLARWLPHRHRALLTDRVDLSPNACEFLHASIRRERFRRRRAATVLSVLLIVALVGAGIAVVQRRDAQEQQRIATARELIAQADATPNNDPWTALRLGIAAERVHPGGEARASLVSTLSNAPYAYTLTSYSEPVSSVALSHDGRTLAAGSYDGTVKLWDVTDRARPRPLAQPLIGYHGRVLSVAFAPDRDILATGGDNGTAILWDVTDRAEPRLLGQPLTGITGKVESVAFAPNGSTLATGSNNGTVILWDLTDPTRPHPLNKPLTGYYGSMLSVAFSRDGKILATGGDHGTAILWDLTDRAQPRLFSQPLTGLTGTVESVAFAPNDSILATGSDNGTVILWDLTDRAQPRILGQPLTDHPSGVFSITFSRDGHTLAVGCNDGTVILRNLIDPVRPRRLGQPLKRQNHAVLGDHADHIVESMAFTPDGKTLATASHDRTLTLYDLTSLAPTLRLGQPLTDHTGPVHLAIAPNGVTLATASENNPVILWDIRDPAQPHRLDQPLADHTAAVYSVAFAPDGHTLASASLDGRVILWDLTDPAHPKPRGSPLIAHNGEVRGVAFSPDGTILASGGADGRVILWDLTDPAQPRKLGQPLTDHSSWVDVVAFAPGGDILASTSEDKTVILWDLADLTHPHRLGSPLADHSGPVYSVAFTPNATTLATAGYDKTVILWDLTGLATLRAHAVERACFIARRGFNRDEWKRYIPGLPYQDTCPA